MKKAATYFIFSFLPIASAMAADNMGFSKYGLVQNVQSYSSNPFWTPDAPYNQRMPTIVYAKGADLNTADCAIVVKSLVGSKCDSSNNCLGMKISDIRPDILVQLSQLQGHNYVTSCAGFIDGAFKEYKDNYSITSDQANFPTPIYPNNNSNTNNVNTPTPSVVVTPQKKTELKNEVQQRSDELDRLQAQNGANDYNLVATQMPKTISDLSFSERVANAKAGYEEWKSVWGNNEKGEYVCLKNCAYQTPHFETTKEALTREGEEEQLRAALIKSKCETWDGKSNVWAGDTKLTPAICNKYKAPETPPANTNLNNTTPGSNTNVTITQPLTDVKNDPKYKDVYGLLITEGPWWSWGAATIGATVGTGVCILTGGVPCLIGTIAGTSLSTSTAAVATAAVGTVAGAGLGAAGAGIASLYRMGNSEDVGKLPDWQSDWKGCFNLCGDSSDGNDLLTMKVIRPILGGSDRYCIQKGMYYTLYNTTKEEPVFFSKSQINKIKSGLQSIADQGYCDGHFNDADAYIVKYTVDSASVSDTGKQELNYTIQTASEAIRIDD